MNKVILMGRLTRDPEVRYSQGDNSMAIARYTLAEAEVYVGVDEPSVPSDVLLVDNNNGIGRVAWTPAPEGLNGGYVDSDKVRYTVFEPSSGKVFKTGVAGKLA